MAKVTATHRIAENEVKIGTHIFRYIEDFNAFQRAEIDEKEALRRYWSHRRTWIQSTSQ